MEPHPEKTHKAKKVLLQTNVIVRENQKLSSSPYQRKSQSKTPNKSRSPGKRSRSDSKSNNKSRERGRSAKGKKLQPKPNGQQCQLKQFFDQVACTGEALLRGGETISTPKPSAF